MVVSRLPLAWMPDPRVRTSRRLALSSVPDLQGPARPDLARRYLPAVRDPPGGCEAPRAEAAARQRPPRRVPLELSPYAFPTPAFPRLCLRSFGQLAPGLGLRVLVASVPSGAFGPGSVRGAHLEAGRCFFTQGYHFSVSASTRGSGRPFQDSACKSLLARQDRAPLLWVCQVLRVTYLASLVEPRLASKHSWHARGQSFTPTS